jgi:hypothetical protein
MKMAIESRSEARVTRRKSSWPAMSQSWNSTGLFSVDYAM